MKFIADRTLGKLARELRLLGFDTLYYRGQESYPMIQQARREGRIVLTRSTKLPAGGPEDKIVRIRQDAPRLQLKELIRDRVLCLGEKTLFSRCLLCNTLLDEIPPEQARGNVPDYVFYHQERFVRCPLCRRVYWRGSHEGNMRKRIVELFQVDLPGAAATAGGMQGNNSPPRLGEAPCE
jgi:uncharacterized protein